MAVYYLQDEKPATKFARSFKAPIYVAKDGTTNLLNTLINYSKSLESDIIMREGLVSEVPKAHADPYKYTQQWKQHNLFDDVAGLGGEDLKRFPTIPEVDELLRIIRQHYLVFLAELRYPRIRSYIHGWVNIIRSGESISKHCHIDGPQGYLAGTYYLTTNNTKLYLQNPTKNENIVEIATEAKKVIFFPSWIPHWSDEHSEDNLRISIAFDITTEESMLGNPWRPHTLLDDPNTMPGLDSR